MAPIAPGARGGASLTRIGSTLYLFGGLGYTGQAASKHTMHATASMTSSVTSPRAGGLSFLNDTYVLDLTTGYWATPICRGTKPSKRSGHSAIAIGPYLLIHGGTTNNRLLHHVALLHTPTNCWSMPAVEGEAVPCTPETRGSIPFTHAEFRTFIHTRPFSVMCTSAKLGNFTQN